MLFDVKTLDTLQKLGLTAYEAKAFTALVTVGPTTATVLSAESEIPRTKIYGVLKRLQEEKWITVSKGKPSTYAPRYPKEVVEQRRTLFCSELEELSNNLTFLYDRQIKTEALNALLIRGIDGISAKMMEMMDRVQRSVTIMGSFLSPVEIGRLNKKIIKAKRRDVTVRIIVTPLPKENDTDIEQAFLPVKNDVRLFVPPSEDLRIFDDRLDDLPGFMRQVIIDRREMLLAIATADEGVPDLDSAIAIWISNASIAQLIMPPMFDRLWELSKQIS